MRAAALLALALALAAGCGAAGSRPAATAPRCPRASELWPVLEWSEAVSNEALDRVARAILDGAWLRDRRSQGIRPRIQVGPIRNRSTFYVGNAFKSPLEERLQRSGTVTLVAEEHAKLDGIIHVLIREVLEPGEATRTSGFAFEVAIADSGVEPEAPGAQAWRFATRITRALRPAPRPASCPEPTWSCPGVEGYALKTGCGVNWSCRNGRFALSCAPAEGGKARCRCERAGVTVRSFELEGDLCAGSGAESKAQAAANRECGWRLPAL